MILKYLSLFVLLLWWGCGDDDFVPAPLDVEPTNGLRYRTLNRSNPVNLLSSFCDSPTHQIHRNRRIEGTGNYAVRMGWFPDGIPITEVAVQFFGTDGAPDAQQRNLATVSGFLDGSRDARPLPWVVVELDGLRYQSLLFDETGFTVEKMDANMETFYQFNIEATPDCPVSWGTTIKTKMNFSGHLYNTDPARPDSVYLGWLVVEMNNTAYAD